MRRRILGGAHQRGQKLWAHRFCRERVLLRGVIDGWNREVHSGHRVGLDRKAHAALALEHADGVLLDFGGVVVKHRTRKGLSR